ncbi:MAG TPA: hypothetical protein DIU15_17590 [Deltaproteobacteria bacterium]|nr:hypothetical protein [Deltaproteobacteria bacterium]
MRLHWFWSTNPQKVRLALEELGLDYELLFVDLAKHEQKSPDYRSIHPRSKVPALEVDGSVLWESNAALVYLGERQQQLWPKEPKLRAKGHNLMFLEAAAYQGAASTFFLQRAVKARAGKPANEEKLDASRPALDALHSVLESQLGDADYLLGDFSMIECAYGPWLPVVDLEGFPRLADWRQRIMNRPSWGRCEFSYGIEAPAKPSRG